jgi:hypothetical protein
MVPIGAATTSEDKTGPYRVVRYNLQPAVEIDGDTAPAIRPASLTTMEKLAPIPCPPAMAANGPTSPINSPCRQHRRGGLRHGRVLRLPVLAAQ